MLYIYINIRFFRLFGFLLFLKEYKFFKLVVFALKFFAGLSVFSAGAWTMMMVVVVVKENLTYKILEDF